MVAVLRRLCEGVRADLHGERAGLSPGEDDPGATSRGDAADYVIILDPWWNPAVENQAADRAHRIGQSRPVTIYRLIARDTVEERVLALHKEKRDLAADMLDGTGSSHLNSEILMGLLQGPEEEKL